MKKISKNINDIPKILTSKSREKYFLNNIKENKYLKTELYNTKEVKEKLKSLYDNKCVYCEKSLLDFPAHIEHYRPKSIYYWLVFSWDNLFLCCPICNINKGNKFEVKNNPVSYNNETFKDIHRLRDEYDEIEQPLTINPEKENILDKIRFNENAKMSSEDKRIQHTIDNVCKLNRKDLVEKRARTINGFIDNINEIKFRIYKNKGDLKEVSLVLKRFKKEQEFYSLRHFILNNLNLYL